MSTLQLDDGFALDVERVLAHLQLHGVEGIEDRIDEILGALDLLTLHPLIGRPLEGAERVLVLGEGSRGYVARYRYDELDDVVIVLGLRAQRESGFTDR